MLGNLNIMDHKIVKTRLRPPCPYPLMLTLLIENSPEQRMTLMEIFDAIQKKYPKHYANKNQDSWRSTVRFNLCRSGLFYQVKHSKQVHWKIIPECRGGIKHLQHYIRKNQKQRYPQHQKMLISNIIN